MKLHAAAARHGLGRLVGGDEGRLALEAARAAFAEEGIASVERFVRLYAPGLAVSSAVEAGSV